MGQLKATTKTTSSCSQSVTSLPHVKETMIKSKSWATPSQTGPSRADSAILQYESPIHTPFLLFDVTWHKIQLYILLMNELLNCISKIEGHFSWSSINSAIRTSSEIWQCCFQTLGAEYQQILIYGSDTIPFFLWTQWTQAIKLY